MDLKLTLLATSFLLLLVLSLGGNAFLIHSLHKSKKAPVPTQDAKDVLSSLLQGQAILQIRVLDPENLMMRSPRR